MKSGALFAGYGGLDLAVEEVFGATPAWVSEIEPGPSKILAARFPGVPTSPRSTGQPSSPSTSSPAARPARTCPTPGNAKA
jgi:site-specific DNA-cytosine methylase